MIYSQYPANREMREKFFGVGRTRRFAVVADAAGVGSWFKAVAGKMSHLETVPALNVFGIAWFLKLIN